MGFRTEVPDSEVTFEVVSYEDPTRFEPFDCRREDRPSPSANEINDLIRTGAWRSWGPGVACLEFATDGSVIGYAVLLFEPFYHPETTSDDEALYLNAAIIAVDRRWQGRRDPISAHVRDDRSRPGETDRYSDVIMRTIETIIAPARPDAVGIYSLVREDNLGSIALLVRNGYIADEDPFIDAGSKAVSRVYRKMRDRWAQ